MICFSEKNLLVANDGKTERGQGGGELVRRRMSTGASWRDGKKRA